MLEPERADTEAETPNDTVMGDFSQREDHPFWRHRIKFVYQKRSTGIYLRRDRLVLRR